MRENLEKLQQKKNNYFGNTFAMLDGKKFRRQHPLANYILDFYCHECKLAIELDGSAHNNKETKEYDEKRMNELNQHGIKVLRFWNDEITNNLCGVLNKIRLALK